MTTPSDPHEPGHDPVTGQSDTGHEWDGIRELDTPLPRWWLWIFYASIAFSIGYWVLMPSWPGLTGYTPGLLHYTDRANLRHELAGLQAQRGAQAAQLQHATLQQIEADPVMRNYAANVGRSIFGDNCATCHGVAGTGGPGYPNLRDDVWLWGGSLDDVYHTITVGVRANHPDTRMSQMPAFGRDGILQPGQITDATEYVVSLSGRPVNAPMAARGHEVFTANCVSCHGADGRGRQSEGAPNLTDRDWLYGASRAAIEDQITNAHGGVMPSWAMRFDDATRRALAVYIRTEAGG
jgi:cytochrome c oxidase cbb3-type subunit 3